jgi:hypothetical protein
MMMMLVMMIMVVLTPSESRVIKAVTGVDVLFQHLLMAARSS